VFQRRLPFQSFEFRSFGFPPHEVRVQYPLRQAAVNATELAASLFVSLLSAIAFGASIVVVT